VTKYPTLLVVTDPVGHGGEKFTGTEFTVKALQDFFRPFAYGEKKQ